MKPYRAFPPGQGNLKIPTSSRLAARAGLALYAPCRPRGRLARWIAWRTVGFLGPKTTPGKPVEWQPPVKPGIWETMKSEWRRLVGRFDEVAVHERIQQSRGGFAGTLLAEGIPAGFVKVRDGESAPMLNEHRALEAMGSSRPRFFEVPRPLAVGKVAEWNYLLTAALAPDLHRMPVEPPLPAIVGEIRAGLEALSRPANIPAHWEPMHGDFTPWNLRQRRDGTLFLIDWEDAGWAPPGADEVYYRAVVQFLSRKSGECDGQSDEAGQFWLNRIEARRAQAGDAKDADADLGEALLSIFGAGTG